MLQMLIMAMMFFNAFMFTQTTHPLSMGIILLFQTILTCGLTGLMSKNFWFAYVLFLVFIGGMLILFMYMASLASNEKMTFSSPSLIKFMIYWCLLFMNLLLLDKFYTINWFLNEEMSLSTMNSLIQENTLSLSKTFNWPNNWVIILLVSYLLLTLIMVVKITNLFTGPLRPKSN